MDSGSKREPGEDLRNPAGADTGRQAIERKLDELIDLLKRSIGDQRAGGPPTGGPTIGSEISREIARDVAGRLRQTLEGCFRAQEGRPQVPPPAKGERIPLDDVASIIDRITGSGPP